MPIPSTSMTGIGVKGTPATTGNRKGGPIALASIYEVRLVGFNHEMEPESVCFHDECTNGVLRVLWEFRIRK
jgi:hypothetical protein